MHCALVVHIIRHAVVVEQVRKFGQVAGVTPEHVPAAVPAAVPWHTLFGVKTFVVVLHAASPQEEVVQQTPSTHRPDVHSAPRLHREPFTRGCTHVPATHTRARCTAQSWCRQWCKSACRVGSQRPGAQLVGPGVPQVPAPSQFERGCTDEPAQLAAIHCVPVGHRAH